MKIILVLFAVFTFDLTGASSALAWGERGHHLICQVATRLVKEEKIKTFLETRGDIMGHACNVPDIYWRDISDPVAKTGDASHFLDPENAGLTPDQIPTNISEYFNHLKTDATSQKKADTIGTLWWRAAQLWKLAVQNGIEAYKALPPKNSSEQQQKNLPFNVGVYGFIINLGLMGHFVGDATMPMHNSADYDGWNEGHGGLHGFYETQCVSHYGLKLIKDVETKAKHLRNKMGSHFDSDIEVIDRMKEISVASYSEKTNMIKLDKVLAPSQVVKNSDGSTKKVYAVRSPLNEACPAFRGQIIKELARASVTLAALWDQAFRAAQRPQVAYYISYRYPLTPDFVKLDYLP